MQGKGKRKGSMGRERPRKFQDYTDQDYQDLCEEKVRLRKAYDRLIAIAQEGKMSGRVDTLGRKYRTLAMFVGCLATGFEGPWITDPLCLICGASEGVARCAHCQCGICERHGHLLSRAKQDKEGKWQGGIHGLLRQGPGRRARFRSRDVRDQAESDLTVVGK